MQKPAAPVNEPDPLEATARVRRAAAAPQTTAVRPAPQAYDAEDPMEVTVRTPRGFRKPAKAADDWTKAAPAAPVKPVPAAEMKPVPAPQVRYDEDPMEATMAVRRADTARTEDAKPVNNAPVVQEDPMEHTFRVPRAAQKPVAQTPAVEVVPAADPEAKLEETLAVRRMPGDSPVQEDAQLETTMAVRRAENNESDHSWVDDTGLTDNIAGTGTAAAEPADEQDIAVLVAQMDEPDSDAPVAAAVVDDSDGGLFVADLDEMDGFGGNTDEDSSDAEVQEDEWDPEAQMDTVVQLIEVDDEDSSAAEEAHEVIVNAPSAYKPMWDAHVGAEDRAMAEDFSMVMEQAAMASLPEEKVFYTSVSVTELMEDDDPGEAPELWEDEWESDGPSLVRISSLDAIEDFRVVDAGILEDVDDDVLLEHKDKAGAELGLDTHVTVRMVPAQSETMGPRKPVKEQPAVPVVPAAAPAPAPVAPVPAPVSKPKAPVVGWLVCIRGGHRGESFPLVTGRNSIGRAPEMDVPLMKDESVTEARHAILTYEPRKRQFFIQPGESTGLVYLNDQLIFQHEPLKANDQVEFGDDAYLFVPLCGPSFGWDSAK